MEMRAGGASAGGSGPSDHVVPQNLDAEISVLGASMLTPNVIPGVSEIIRPSHFYRQAHQRIFEAIEDLFSRGEPVDPITVCEELANRAALDAVGGKAFVHSLVTAVPAATNARHYAEIVRENYFLRSLIRVGSDIAEMGYRRERPPIELIDRAEQMVFDISQSRVTGEFEPIADLITENYAELERAATVGHHTVGCQTGFRDVDEKIGGFQPSNLVILAARPSMGKTAFALNIARNVAVDQQKGVAVFSLEMSKMEVVTRMMCSEARVDLWRVRRSVMQPKEWSQLAAGCTALHAASIFIDDSASLNLMEMRAKARRLKAREKNLGLIVVDYLQLMVGDANTENRQQEISRISRGLKILARELEVPVLALSQLSRQVEQRAGNKPVLSDLRECVTGDSLVCLADGRRVPVRDLAGLQPDVIAMTADGRLTEARSDCVWSVGVKPVFEMRTASGRRLRATANHRVLGGDGWVTVGELDPGDRVALAHRLPEPARTERWSDGRVALLGHMIGDGSYLSGQPMRYTTGSLENGELVASVAEDEFGAEVRWYRGTGNWFQLLISGNGNRRRPTGLNHWLRELGVFGQRSHDKRIPGAAFQLDDRQVAVLLRHLWATDGTLTTRREGSRGSAGVRFTTASLLLAEDVASLLLRLGIVARIKRVAQRGSLWFSVEISGAEAQRTFLDRVGAFGPKCSGAERLRSVLQGVRANTNVDTLPEAAFTRVREAMAEKGVSHRAMAAMRGTAYGGSSQFHYAPSRAVVLDHADLLGEQVLKSHATSDLFWDKVVEVVPVGEEEVFDLTVPGPACWLADGIVTHNSGALEQDADLVLFIYRDEVYNRDSPDKGTAEIIVGKQRNGPIGECKLAFMQDYTRFADLDARRLGPQS